MGDRTRERETKNWKNRTQIVEREGEKRMTLFDPCRGYYLLPSENSIGVF